MGMIDKDTVINMINEMREEGYCDAREIRDRIMFMPEIDTEPVKHGRWIAIANGNMKNWKQKCSCCGYITRGKGKYCKECGARMDAEDINVLAKDGGADNG